MLNQETAKAARTDSGYILRAPRRMRVADAVAQYMRVPMGAGNSVPWDPLVAPYVLEPMNCLASREYDAVIFVGPARTGKTIGLIDGWVIYNVICDPADMLIIQMTEEKAREHSKKRLARTFRVSPEVVSRLSPNKNDNNVYDRTFLAGNYLKIGWPSVNIMSSSDYKCVALTDYDRFPEDIDGEGDAFSLASKRTTTFMSSGMTLVESSPGRDVKDVKWRRTSPHEAPPTTGILSLYNRGDRRRWYWPCPHCGEYFQPCGDVVAGFRDIADPVLASEAAYIQCPSCSGRIMPEQKRELNGRGVWLRDGESINADGSRYGDPRRSRIASFWMEGPAAAYQTLSQLVYKLLTAEQEYETTGSEETLKTVINTDWGLPYLPRASMEQRKSELLEQRAEPVPSRSVPDGVNFLVATVDVQAGRHRRFVVQVTGYGSRGERWIIDRYNITQSLRGDSDGESQRIDPASYPEDWDVLLTDVFHKSWPLASDPSQQMRLMAMAVDSGGEDGVTDNAYKFWRRCRRDGLGMGDQQRQRYQVQLSLSNLHGMVTGMAEDLQSLVGGTVVRRKVYARFLDAVNFVNGNSDADPEQEVISRWRIEQCSELSAVSASFVLSTPTETDGAVFPGRIMLANTCTWTYRGDECGYHGPAVADEYDQPTSDITKDKCSKCLSGCKFRNNVGNFGGFLSINKLSQ